MHPITSSMLSLHVILRCAAPIDGIYREEVISEDAWSANFLAPCYRSKPTSLT